MIDPSVVTSLQALHIINHIDSLNMDILHAAGVSNQVHFSILKRLILIVASLIGGSIGYIFYSMFAEDNVFYKIFDISFGALIIFSLPGPNYEYTQNICKKSSQYISKYKNDIVEDTNYHIGEFSAYSLIENTIANKCKIKK
jgi:hypothetical protein